MVSEARGGEQEAIIDKCHKTLVQILWSIVCFELDIDEIKKVSTSRLEAIVHSYGLPNIVDGCGILRDGVSGYYGAKFRNLTKQ